MACAAQSKDDAMSALTLSGVSVRRNGRVVLDGIDVNFAAGRLTAVIGPNGAGKSTLLDVAAGLLAPERGEILLANTALRHIPRRQLAIRRAYLPQSPRIEWAISVERVVALGLSPQLPAFGAIAAEWRQQIDAALARYDLLDLRDRSATELSGGELGRVMLARATVSSPELLIVDEPTSGLDPRHALDAGKRLRALADAGCTVIVALHDLDLASRIADDVVAVKSGRIAQQGPSGTMLIEPVLGSLYDMAVRVTCDETGRSIRFIGER
jgi:iron complex transport system ATP-binding protein